MGIRVGILGASGRMGRQVARRVIAAPDLELVFAATHPGSASFGLDIGTLSSGTPTGLLLGLLGSETPVADVVIDFALPAGTLAALPSLNGAALVSGVTGLTSQERATLLDYDGALLLAANFSLGVTVLAALVEQAAAVLAGFDIEIIEAHHGQKQDAPSGTALRLAQAAADARGLALEEARRDGRHGAIGPRGADEIGMHALRGGSVTGHHSVWFAGPSERLVLTHEAESRDVFAEGAIRAARWLAHKPRGHYCMREVLGLPPATC